MYIPPLRKSFLGLFFFFFTLLFLAIFSCYPLKRLWKSPGCFSFKGPVVRPCVITPKDDGCIYAPKRPFFSLLSSSSSSSVYSFLVSFPPCATLLTYFSQVFFSKSVKIKMTSEHFGPSLLDRKLTFRR